MNACVGDGRTADNHAGATAKTQGEAPDSDMELRCAASWAGLRESLAPNVTADRADPCGARSGAQNA